MISDSSYRTLAKIGLALTNIDEETDLSQSSPEVTNVERYDSDSCDQPDTPVIPDTEPISHDQEDRNTEDGYPFDLEEDEEVKAVLSDDQFLVLMTRVSRDVFRHYREEKWKARRRSRDQTIQINTMYKNKSQKVQPVDDAPPDGSTPPGSLNWKEDVLKEALKNIEGPDLSRTDGPYQNITPRFAKEPRGIRLTPERLKALDAKLKDTELTDQEKEVFIEVLFRREKALAWGFDELGKIREEIAPPYVIKTRQHKAWQAKNIPIPAPLRDRVIKILQDRIKAGILEESHSPYRNAWFVVEKKNGGLRLINSVTKLNAQTIRDAFLPKDCDTFAEEFAACVILSCVDLFSGYDHLNLSVYSRDMTTFATPLGLLRFTTIPMGATNSVAHFLRAMNRMLFDLIPHICEPFFDDVGVKGPNTRYDDQEIYPGIRRFVLEHIENLAKVLLNFELAGATANPEKSEFCKPTAEIVGYICGSNGRLPGKAKVLKILEWDTCKDVSEVRSFLGLTVYFRIWIENYATETLPLTRLLRKGEPFVWDEPQIQAMTRLKEALTSPPCLIMIDYKSDRQIVLKTDASGQGWGAVIGQLDDQGNFRPSRYESGAWKGAELRYDATKQECLAVMKALRRLRNYLYGVRFLLETDAKVLISQLNDSFSSLPGAALSRWIAYIKMFDFEIKHVSGKRNTIADALSRKPSGPSDQEDEKWEGDLDDFIDAQLNMITLLPVDLEAQSNDSDLQDEPQPAILFPTDKWSAESQEIARYLTTLRLPKRLSADQTEKGRKARTKFKNKAVGYVVSEGILWKKGGKNQLNRRVIDHEPTKRRLIADLHIQYGHKGRDSTYRRISGIYYWKGMYKYVADAIKACVQCQKADQKTPSDKAGHSSPDTVLACWILDVQYMPDDYGCKAIIEAREQLSDYLEAAPLRAVNSANVAKFMRERIILQHGQPLEIRVDGGPEFKDQVTKACMELGIKRIVGPPYFPQAQGQVEVGHKPIKFGLMKITDGTGKKWTQHLSAIVWADRTTIKPSGLSPYEIIYNRRPILPIEAAIPSWRVLNWKGVNTEEDLLAMRTRMIERRSVDIDHVAQIIAEKRRAMAQRNDQRNAHRMRKEPLKVNDLVLLYDTPRHIDMSRKRQLQYSWQGPYLISRILGTDRYIIKHPGGNEVQGSIAGNRLKLFIQDHQGYWEPADPENDEWTTGPSAESIDQENPAPVETAIPEPEEDDYEKIRQPEAQIEVDIPTGTKEGYEDYFDIEFDEIEPEEVRGGSHRYSMRKKTRPD